MKAIYGATSLYMEHRRECARGKRKTSTQDYRLLKNFETDALMCRDGEADLEVLAFPAVGAEDLDGG